MTQQKRTPKLTIRDDGDAATPSERLINQSLVPETLTADSGMKISVRQPDVLAPYDLIEAVGPETAANQTYMQMINPLIYIGDIDGDPVMAPSSLSEVRVLIKRLGHAGMEALNSWYYVNIIAPTLSAMEQAKKQARVKN